MATARSGPRPTEAHVKRIKALRITAGTVAGVASLALALALTLTPGSLGLPSSPALYEKVRAEDRAGEGVIVAWALLAIPVGGLLQTPVARLRGGRIGAGWALLTGYWLYVLLVAVAAWQVQGLFPPPDGPGKSGGLFGALTALALATPVCAACSGAVFRMVPGEHGDTLDGQIRGHLATVALLAWCFNGTFISMLTGKNFTFPRSGSFAMFFPGGLLWGFHAGAALGMLIGARLQRAPEARAATMAVAASLARTAAVLLLCCLCVAQLGWILPTWAVALSAFPVLIALFTLGPRNERLGHWVEFHTVELLKGGFDR
ncbi:hypothetical protein ACF09G_21375 [Streptomyces albogriseolus]|uniref:hypothetical protein n=1 Tax=Streptomyces albogriseolus TaxID=1887 RepID=UPI0036FC7710|nr:hypothetical protein [Streptomyces albogriseolus]